MAKERSESVSRSREDKEEEDKMEVRNVNSSKEEKEKKSKRKSRESSGSESESEPDERRRPSRSKRESKSKSKSKSRRHSSSESASESYSSSEGSYSESESESEESEVSEDERRRRKRKERKRREREREERERRRRKDKEKKRRKKEEKKRKKKKKDKGSKGAVTESWGKYGIIKETDMWNKRPEFTAWLAEVKQVNLESLPNWEEKQMFKDFMEDHNTATFPSKKYYDLDAYHRRKLEKQMKKGLKKVIASERTVFDDEEQRRLELLREREKQKAEEVENLKRQMQSGMAQAMKEQAQLREEMAYQYKLGNFEAAAAIQRRLDPDVPM